MKISVLVVSVVGLLLSIESAGAKTLYVNSASGNDAISYAQNGSAAPWRTLGRAVWGSTSQTAPNTAEAARAGDIVEIVGGPFTAPATNSRFTPAFNPVNTGTASAPITLRAQGRVELRTTGGVGPAMGAYVRNYIRWEGNFYIDETFVPPTSDTGPIVLWDTTGSVVDGCEVEGRNINYIDNHNGVRINTSHNSVMRNCRINGIVGGTAPPDRMHHNKAGVMLYFCSDILIENNEITNSGSGIYPKGGDNYNITVRYNKLVGNHKAIRVSFSDPNQGANRMYQNVIINGNGDGDDSMGIDLAENTNNWTIVNNTIYNVSNGFLIQLSGTSANNRIANNIVANSRTGINAWEYTSPIPGPGRNLYFNATEWAWNNRTYGSLVSWLAAVTTELGSISGNPLFFNAAGNDFRIAASSPATLLGLDILDLNGNGNTADIIPAGAYVRGSELIGRNLGPVPSAPTATVQ